MGTTNTFNDNTTSAFLITGMNKAIIDTGTSLIYVPYGMFVKFVKAAFKDTGYEVFQTYIVATCDLTKLRSIFIYVNDQYLEITPASYVLNLDIGMEGKCLMAFTQNA